MKIFVKNVDAHVVQGSSLYSCLILVYQFRGGDNLTTQALCLFCAQHVLSTYMYLFNFDNPLIH